MAATITFSPTRIPSGPSWETDQAAPSPGENKTHLVFEQGHFDFPRNTVAREVSDWFDRHLAPVR